MRFYHLAALAVATALLTAAPAFAADAPAPAQKLNLGDVQKNLKPLAGAFGVNTPDPPATQAAPATDDHKTVGDVADRALDMVQKVVGQVEDGVSKMAPKVWEIMIRQQYAKAYSGLVVPGAWFFGAMICCLIFGKLWKEIDGKWGNGSGDLSEAGWNNVARLIVTRILPSVVMFIAGIELAYAAKEAILLLVNPQYYAIQDLLQSIMNGGQPPS